MMEIQLEVPQFLSVEEAESFLIKITSLVGFGELGLQSALDLSTLVRNWISAKHQAAELEIKRAAQGDATGDQLIRIEGGLPELPGTTIDMPHKLNGHAIESLPASGPVPTSPDPGPLPQVTGKP
jgi:hypothetical protein